MSHNRFVALVFCFVLFLTALPAGSVLSASLNDITSPIYFEMVLDESRGWIYGSDSTGNKIDVISTTTLELVKSFALVNGAAPKGISLSPDGNELAIAQNGAGSILFLNPDTGATIATTSDYKSGDVVFGRAGRLYSVASTNNSDSIHVIDTTTHVEISGSSFSIYSGGHLALSSDKKALFVDEATSSRTIYKFDVSTDTLPNPRRAGKTGYSTSYLLSADNNKLFIGNGQVWSSDLNAQIGSFSAAGYLAEIPGQNLVAVISKTTPGLVTFVKTTDYYTASTYTIDSAGTAGPGVASSDGSKLYVNTLNGLKVIDLNALVPVPPTSPTPVIYFDMVLDESRGWIYGSDSVGNKIDILSTTTLELVKSFVLVNGATPKGIALSPDGGELVVAQNGASSLLFLNPDTGATIATVIPNVYDGNKPWDVIYGRAGRLYSSGSNIHVIDTSTHTEVSRSISTVGYAPYLAISSDKNSLFANETVDLNRFDVSTDTIPNPGYAGEGFFSENYLLLADNSKFFTDTGQVWSLELKTNIGSFGAGYLAEIPGRQWVAVISKETPGLVTFVKTTDYHTASTYTIPLAGAAGPGVASSDGNKLYVNTLNGLKVVDLQDLVPAPAPSPTPVIYFEMVLDETRGWIYGSDSAGNKIDVLSTTTLELVKSFVLVNGATPKGIALSPDGSELAVAQNGASSLLFLNPDTGATIATIIPNVYNPKMPYDVIYGRDGRLYSCGNPGSGGSDYIHVIDTVTHTEISKSSFDVRSSPSLAISSDKNSLFATDAHSSKAFYKFNVSTDTIPTPTSTTTSGSGFLEKYLLLADNSKLFTDTGQVWSSDLVAKLGSFDMAGYLAEIPGQNLVAVISKTTPGLITFVRTTDYYPASTYTIASAGTAGPGVVSSDESTLYVNTLNGLKVVDLQALVPTPPSSPTPVIYFEMVLDESRGWIYGSDSTGNKVDVISATTLELVKSFTLVNSAEPKGIALSPDGSELAVAQNGASSLLFLNPDTGATIATIIPNVSIPKLPYDVIYGRSGRLYSSGNPDEAGLDYIHVINTVTHTEVSRSGFMVRSSPYLAVSSDKNSLFANTTERPNRLYKFDVSTDTIPTPTSTAYASGFSATNFLLLADNSKVFTDKGQVWSSNLSVQLGSFSATGTLAEIPSLSMVAVISKTTPGLVTFVRTTNYSTASTYTIAAAGANGPGVVTSDESKLYLNTLNGMKVVDLQALVSLYGGSPQSTEVQKPFAAPFKVLVKDIHGNPISGMEFTFTAPVSGAGGTFSDSGTNVTTAITNTSGIATSSIFVANSVAGSYKIKATASGLASFVDFQLANVFYFTISGNAGVEGAVLSYIDGSLKSVMADENGAYAFAVPQGWTGIVTPSKSGYTFSPGNRSYANLPENQTAQNYTAASVPSIAHVKPGGLTTSGCGQTWANACDLQYALTNAISSNEIWVAAGVYKPTTSGTDREATFQLKNGVAIYGGFAGTETDRDQRDFDSNETILSGDLLGNDTDNVAYDEPSRAENSYHVVVGSGTSNSAVLDGFTVTGGNATDYYDVPCDLGCGGGMYNVSGSPTLRNVIFSANTTTFDGGGMYNVGSSPALTNVTFSSNSAGNRGGGIFNINDSNSTLTNVDIIANTAYEGGGIFNYFSSPTLTNMVFSENFASLDGGGMWNGEGDPTLTNVTFSDNAASSYGGGMLNFESNPILMNVTFSANSAGFQGGGMYIFDGNPTLHNVIIANSLSGGDCYSSGTTEEGGLLNPASSHNLFQDEFNGCDLTGGVNGNIVGSDPLLGPLADNGGLTQTHALLPGSPAIDAGTNSGCPSIDQRGVARPQGTHCDIGAYEVEQAVPSVHTFTVTTPINSLNIPITAFTATDDVLVTGYLITESTTVPGAGDAGWTSSAPATYTVASQGSYTLYPWAKDADGNISSVFGSPVSAVVDSTSPSVVSIALVGASPTNAASVDFTVTFSEAVTGVNAADFGLTSTGSISDAAVTGISGSGITYTVTVSTGTGSGTLRLDVVETSDIEDLAGNPLGGLPYTGGEAYSILKNGNISSPWIGSVSIASDQNVVAVARPHLGSEVTSYIGATAGSTTQYVPMLFKGAFGGTYNAALYLQNVSATAATLSLEFTDSSGAIVYTKTDTLDAHASKGYWLPAETGLPNGFAGGVKVISTQPILAVGRPHINGQVMTYNGMSSGATTAWLPMFFKNGFGGSYNSALYVQNVTGSGADLTIEYINLDGTVACTDNDTLGANASKGYWSLAIACDTGILPGEFVGGVKVTSTQDILAVGRAHLGTQITTYNGSAAGATSAYLPMLFRNAFAGGSYDAALYLQNVSGSSADVTIEYLDNAGAVAATQNVTLAANAISNIWLPSVVGLADDFAGGARITSTQNVIAVGRPHLGSEITSYNGALAGSLNAYLSMLFKDAYGSGYDAAFYIQNTSGSAANVEISFYDSAGVLSCVKSIDLAAGATQGFWMPTVTCEP